MFASNSPSAIEGTGCHGSKNSPLKSPLHIVVVSAFDTPFIQDDVTTLSRHFGVRHFVGHGVIQALRVARAVTEGDIVLCWFASVYGAVATLLASVMGKPSIIIVGGVDLAKDVELGYGTWLSPWRSFLVARALRCATAVLAVDESLVAEAKERARYEGGNIRVLPTGYDAEVWKPAGRKERVVLTVAVAHDVRRARLKGIDTLIEAAILLPKVSFEIVGVDARVAAELGAPSNVKFQSPMTREDLLPLYRRSKTYCQPSRREGLPNSLCEAMLCGCIPVATDVGGNKHAVGETGFVVPPRRPDELAKALARALRLPVRHGSKARNRIRDLFPADRRERELVFLIRQLTS